MNMKIKSGFTLIESLIVISIIALLVSAGVLSYRQFALRQQVESNIRNLVEDLKIIQKLSSSGNKTAPGCTGVLDGYVWAPANCNGSNCRSYETKVRCNQTTSLTPLKRVDFPTNLTLIVGGVPTGGIIFKSLEQGTNIPTGSIGTQITVRDSVSNYARTVTVTNTGEIE